MKDELEIKNAYEKGKLAAVQKYKRWGMMLNRFHVKDNPYTVTGSGKKLKAAWHNGFVNERK